jgi:hypothetical protein
VVLFAECFARLASSFESLALRLLVGHSESCPRCLSSPLLRTSLDRGEAKHRQSGSIESTF